LGERSVVVKAEPKQQPLTEQEKIEISKSGMLLKIGK